MSTNNKKYRSEADESAELGSEVLESRNKEIFAAAEVPQTLWNQIAAYVRIHAEEGKVYSFREVFEFSERAILDLIDSGLVVWALVTDELTENIAALRKRVMASPFAPAPVAPPVAVTVTAETDDNLPAEQKCLNDWRCLDASSFRKTWMVPGSAPRYIYEALVKDGRI